MTNEQLAYELQLINDPLVERKESWAVSRVFELYREFYGKSYPKESGCINCAFSAFFQMKSDLREIGIFVKSKQKIMIKYEMIVDSFMLMDDPGVYLKSKMTDELAEKLIKSIPAAKQYFKIIQPIQNGENNKRKNKAKDSKA